MSFPWVFAAYLTVTRSKIPSFTTRFEELLGNPSLSVACRRFRAIVAVSMLKKCSLLAYEASLYWLSLSDISHLAGVYRMPDRHSK